MANATQAIKDVVYYDIFSCHAIEQSAVMVKA